MLAVLSAALFTTEASGQTLSRLTLRGEVGVARMLTAHQVDALGFGTAVGANLRAGFRVLEPLALQLSFSTAYFPADQGGGQLYGVTLGARYEPSIRNLGRLFVDLDVGVGSSGTYVPIVGDVGAGFEFSLLRALGVGPYVRVNGAYTGDVSTGALAVYLTGGLSLSLRVPEDLDPDRDGVERPLDQCEHEAAGDAPDPAHPGCPLHDRDGDGVLDATDLCPTAPSGATPDPTRAGCPLADRDHDGRSDADDACPDVPAGPTPDASRAGCPSPDTDGDGVVDALDQCPTALRGDHPDPARVGCPSTDTDGDGRFDSDDACPNEPAGFNPDPARAGCPAPDRDHDAVPDAVDACADSAGAPSSDARANGCPGLVSVTSDAIRIVTPVFFAPRRDTILRRSEPVLRAVAEALRATQAIRRMAVEGHTDDLGDDGENLTLSQRRAESVMGWLVQHLVDAPRLEAHGYGETRPLVPGTTSQARAANRRVEFRIVDPRTGDAPPPPPMPVPSIAAPTEEHEQHGHHRRTHRHH